MDWYYVISFTLINGRQGLPSLNILILPVVIALATKSLSTRSNRSLGLKPQAVEKRRHVIMKSFEA